MGDTNCIHLGYNRCSIIFHSEYYECLNSGLRTGRETMGVITAQSFRICVCFREDFDVDSFNVGIFSYSCLQSDFDLQIVSENNTLAIFLIQDLKFV